MDEPPDSIARVAAHPLALCACAAALAVLMTWPLAPGITSLGRTQNSGDARFAVWNVAWVANALTSDPAQVFDANIFHPHRRTLAYSEANLGAGTLAIPVWLLTRSAITSHNFVVLLSFAASVVFAWLLVRRLTGDTAAAWVGAILFAFCPYLFSHTAHIQLLMVGGIPAVMLLFHRLADAPSARAGIHLGLALAATGLSCAYYGIFMGLAVGYATLFYAWTRGLWSSRQYWIAIAAAAMLSVAAVLPFFLPYLQIRAETGFARSLDDARMFSPSWKSYLASAAWPHRWMLPHLRSWNNEVLFPGFAALILAPLGFIAALKDRRQDRPSVSAGRETAIFYASLAAIVFWASLGPDAGLYTAFYKTVPVFSLLRAPGRMGIVVMLALAVFAGFGVRAIRRRLAGRHAAAAGALLVLAAILDLRQFPFDWRRDEPPPSSYLVLARMPRGPVAEFPFYHRRSDFHVHTRYMLNSTVHWQPLLNGYSDHIPLDFRTLAVRLGAFPSRDGFDALKERDVRYITIRRDATPILEGLQEYLPYLRPIAEDNRTLIYEIVAWP